MRYEVITSNQVIGMHAWKDAPNKYKYLASLHRHVFHIRCWFSVEDPDRQIELNDKQEEIDREIRLYFGEYENGMGVDFDNYSCENIARWCVDTFGCVSCEVLEDGYGGARAWK